MRYHFRDAVGRLDALLFGRAELSIDEPERSARIRALTGARTRLVWVQDVLNRDDHAVRKTLTVLVGLDTDEYPGERQLLPRPGRFTKPLLTPCGDRVVFTDLASGEAKIVNWDGTGLRVITTGDALEVWQDPATGKEWVFVQVRRPGSQSRNGDSTRNPIFRYALDGRPAGEQVWNHTPCGPLSSGSFQVSADGQHAIGVFPAPDTRLLDLQRRTNQHLGTGCWTSIAPDDSRRMWFLDPTHRDLLFVTLDGRSTHKVRINGAPELGGAEIYHPRWSNHPRFVAFTGPYRTPQLRPMSGSSGVELYLGRFNREFTALEACEKVTTNHYGDYFPDVWIERSPFDESLAEPAAAANTLVEATRRWPGDRAGLVFCWENAAANNEIRDPATRQTHACRVSASPRAHFNSAGAMTFDGAAGVFSADCDAFPVLAASSETSQLTIEFTLTPSRRASPGTVLAAYSEDGTPELVLRQEDKCLVCLLWTSRGSEREEFRLELRPIEPDVAHHVALSFGPWEWFAGYLDGRLLAQINEPRGYLHHWQPRHLLLGNDLAAASPWAGQLDGIAIYDIRLDALQIATHHQLNLIRRAQSPPAPARPPVVPGDAAHPPIGIGAAVSLSKRAP